MLGMSKDFVIVLFIAAIFAYGLTNPTIGLYIIGWFAIIKIIWKFLR